MNQVTQEQKDAVTKTFAIAGFFAAILFAVWLAVQIVGVIPSAFSSLASIADGVYNYDTNEKLAVVSENSVVNSGESFTLSWTDMPRAGTYTFAYICTEGTSAEIRNPQGEIITLGCDQPVNLGTDTELDIRIISEKQRFTDVSYTVAYTPNNDAFSAINTTSKITIVNVGIPTYVLADIVDIKTDVLTSPTENSVVNSKPDKSTKSASRPTTGSPSTIEEVIYAIPVSDPSGDTDLEVTYLAVGTLTDKIFTQTGTIPMDAQGSFQFAVENIGTKTSEEWTFTADLPAGITYTSKTQKPLKPSEKAIITIGFEGLTQIGIERFGATLNIENDVNDSNNKFNWAVEVVK